MITMNLVIVNNIEEASTEVKSTNTQQWQLISLLNLK